MTNERRPLALSLPLRVAASQSDLWRQPCIVSARKKGVPPFQGER